MNIPAFRVACAALWLGFCITPPLLLLELAPLGSGLMNAFVLSFAFLMGLAGAWSGRRIVPHLRWRELLLALPFTPIVPFLFRSFIQTVFPITVQGPMGMVDEMVFVSTPWANSGVFLLPLFDNDLRQKEPAVSVHRANVGVPALCLASLILFGLILKPDERDWWREIWRSYEALVFGGLPFVMAVGWFLGVTKKERAGAYWAALGTLVWFVAVVGWAVTGGYVSG